MPHADVELAVVSFVYACAVFMVFHVYNCVVLYFRGLVWWKLG